MVHFPRSPETTALEGGDCSLETPPIHLFRSGESCSAAAMDEMGRADVGGMKGASRPLPPAVAPRRASATRSARKRTPSRWQASSWTAGRVNGRRVPVSLAVAVVWFSIAVFPPPAVAGHGDLPSRSDDTTTRGSAGNPDAAGGRRSRVQAALPLAANRGRPHPILDPGDVLRRVAAGTEATSGEWPGVKDWPVSRPRESARVKAMIRLASEAGSEGRAVPPQHQAPTASSQRNRFVTRGTSGRGGFLW